LKKKHTLLFLMAMWGSEFLAPPPECGRWVGLILGRGFTVEEGLLKDETTKLE
jgi:hypothetical protein